MFSSLHSLFNYQKPGIILKYKFSSWPAALAVAALFTITACTQEQVILDAPNESLSGVAPVDTTHVMVKPATLAPDTSWQFPGPKPLPGAILPDKRILAFYGNPLSRRMGILGEYAEDKVLKLLDEEIARWEAADITISVQPAIHAVIVTAQGKPSRCGKYRLRMTNKVIDDVLAMAKKRDAIVFLDIQVGQSTLQEEIPELASYLKLPNVHLGIDAEFAMQDGDVPGRRIGSFNSDDINYATDYLADLVKTHNLPPKLLIVHRFTQGMIKNATAIKLQPEVQVVMHMDGWGSPALKKDTFKRYIQNEPVQFTGFKIFYKNDTKKGSRLMTPEEVLALTPTPLYIQYQ